MSSLVTALERSVIGKITRPGLDTRKSRPPASTMASDAAMPGVLHAPGLQRANRLALAGSSSNMSTNCAYSVRTGLSPHEARHGRSGGGRRTRATGSPARARPRRSARGTANGSLLVVLDDVRITHVRGLGVAAGF